MFVNANTGFVAMYLSSYPPYFEGGILMTTDGGLSLEFKDTIYYGAQTLQHVGNKIYCFGRYNEFLVFYRFWKFMGQRKSCYSRCVQRLFHR
ncbi:MAG: hypothetical protein M3R36_19125 [Bacteroidota bacterium]|nr:hypothetical protein [Bacteroidota bacterium]